MPGEEPYAFGNSLETKTEEREDKSHEELQGVPLSVHVCIVCVCVCVYVCMWDADVHVGVCAHVSKSQRIALHVHFFL